MKTSAADVKAWAMVLAAVATATVAPTVRSQEKRMG
jgi:hypothetical protein